MSIKAILYSRFDPLEGPKIVHQVPEDSVITTSDPSASIANDASALLTFSTISRFLIPRQSLCGNLISLTPPPLSPSTPPTLILSYPICLQSAHYLRNEFIFNFAIVLSPPDAIDVPSYKSVVSKLAHLMRSLEEQSHFLSDDTSPPGTGKIYSLCETLMGDLNNYCECMIPIDEYNTLNIKLFPTLPNPPPVKAWHVPLFTVRIEQLMDENWDLTMQRIIPFINGVNSVKRIAGLADADIRLTKRCIKHLLYYGCVLLLDIFSFNAIYAPTAEFSTMIASDCEMQAECARYVNTAFEPSGQDFAVSTAAEPGSGSMRSSNLGNMSASGGGALAAMIDDDLWPLTSKGDPVDGVGIVHLFASLKQGLSVREWYAQNNNLLANIDVRRFVTFGIIKGFLYRVHKYAIRTTDKPLNTITSSTDPRPDRLKQNNNNNDTTYNNKNRNTNKFKPNISQPPSQSTKEDNDRSERGRLRQRDRKPYHIGDDGGDETPSQERRRDQTETDDEDEIQTQLMNRFLDGTHCFDEICTELCISESELMTRLARADMGEVVVICR